jgi:hypothetical protein
MRILALDLATHTGWALWDGTRTTAGVLQRRSQLDSGHGSSSFARDTRSILRQCTA